MSYASMVHGPINRALCLTLASLALACDNGNGGDGDGGGTTSSAGASTGAGSDAPPGTTTSDPTGGMNGPTPGLYPRWILRDKNGAPVRAIVEPHCGDPMDCRVPDIGAPPEFRCVHVTMHENRYVGLRFGVADGDPLTCNNDPLPPPGSLCNSEPDCDGPVFHNIAEAFDPDRPDAPRTTFRRGDELFFVSSEAVPAVDCFFVDVIDGCGPGGKQQNAFPILPIPDEFMTLLLAGAPYTLEAAYD